MPKRTLSDVAIKRLPKAPKGKRTTHPDALAPGLVLRVTERGRKSWSVYYNLDGKLARSTLGPWPGISLAEARTQAAKIREWARRGMDPKRALAAEARTAAQAINGPTFGELARAYIERDLRSKVNHAKIANMIEHYLISEWDNRPADTLRRKHLHEITDKILAEGKAPTAGKVQERARLIYDWAVDRDEIELNPFSGMKPVASMTVRDRVLSPEEIRKLWAVWEGYPFGPYQKILLVTGQRRRETANMKWSDIHVSSSSEETWIIPASQSKSNREMRVPLSDLARQILGSLPRVNDYVWCSRTGGPINGFTHVVETAQRDSGVTGWSLHDLRRTFRTGLARLKVDHFVAERALNHAVKGLTAVYNKYDYETEKREAFQRWADDLRITLDPPENVVRIRAEQG